MTGLSKRTGTAKSSLGESWPAVSEPAISINMRSASGPAQPLAIDAAARRSVGRPGVSASVTIAALGVVYGDIGTSPLYAVRQSLVDFGDLSEQAILGALSLIVWALALIVTVKYVIVIMRADNRGEGGLLALTALVLRTARRSQKRYIWIMAGGPRGGRPLLGRRGDRPASSRGG